MNNEKNYSKHIIVFIISSLVLTILMNILVMPQLTKPKVEETNYSFFLDKLEDGEITLVQVKDNQIIRGHTLASQLLQSLALKKYNKI